MLRLVKPSTYDSTDGLHCNRCYGIQQAIVDVGPLIRGQAACKIITEAALTTDLLYGFGWIAKQIVRRTYTS